jgi:hypothetical protein
MIYCRFVDFPGANTAARLFWIVEKFLQLWSQQPDIG